MMWGCTMFARPPFLFGGESGFWSMKLDTLSFSPSLGTFSTVLLRILEFLLVWIQSQCQETGVVLGLTATLAQRKWGMKAGLTPLESPSSGCPRPISSTSACMIQTRLEFGRKEERGYMLWVTVLLCRVRITGGVSQVCMRQHILTPSSMAWLTGGPASGSHVSVRKVRRRVEGWQLLLSGQVVSTIGSHEVSDTTQEMSFVWLHCSLVSYLTIPSSQMARGIWRTDGRLAIVTPTWSQRHWSARLYWMTGVILIGQCSQNRSRDVSFNEWLYTWFILLW